MAQLRGCFDALSGYERQVLDLRVGSARGKPLSRAQTASRMHTGVRSVRTAEHRGLRRLRSADRAAGCGAGGAHLRPRVPATTAAGAPVITPILPKAVTGSPATGQAEGHGPRPPADGGRQGKRPGSRPVGRDEPKPISLAAHKDRSSDTTEIVLRLLLLSLLAGGVLAVLGRRHAQGLSARARRQSSGARAPLSELHAPALVSRASPTDDDGGSAGFAEEPPVWDDHRGRHLPTVNADSDRWDPFGTPPWEDPPDPEESELEQAPDDDEPGARRNASGAGAWRLPFSMLML